MYTNRLASNLRSLGFILVAGALFGGAATVNGQLAEDFDGAGLPFTLTQHGADPGPAVMSGGPTGDFVRISNDVGSQTNTLAFDEVPGFSGPQPAGIQIVFDFSMSDEASHTGCCGQRADGFGVALMATALYGTSGPGPTGPPWERPNFAGAFAVGFDIFDSGTPDDGNTVSINWDGTQIAESLVTAFTLNTGVFNHATIDIVPSGTDALVSVSLVQDINGVPGASVDVFTDVLVPGMDLNALPSFRAVFGGRTGGAFVATDIDNINMTQIPEPATLALLGVGGLAALRRRRRA